ncbi:testis-specific serine/threonine-protein kinase 3-like [Diadema setosum]|uniref:testis-specific serine/threonine-protein kinase 3-like n=1 Tax=Diadema setosum TaxID=31175 RepID=UPI003B3A850C
MMQSSANKIRMKMTSMTASQTRSSKQPAVRAPAEHPPISTPNDNAVMLSRGYCLAHKLGSGSYSKVRMAVMTSTKKRVAVKIIDRKRAPRDYQRNFLPRELALARHLRHPNVLRTHDWFEQNGKVYMILEFAESGDVLEYIRLVTRGPVPERLARTWGMQTARALFYMHGMGLVHRDVKCENLLLDTRFNIKLSDFGFVRRVGKGDLSDTFCGSAAYAAPEIIRSVMYNPFKSDVWALGVVLYILVSGVMPFGDDVTNIRKILQSQCAGVHFGMGGGVREECRELIRGMLTISPADRMDLGNVLESEWLNQAQIVVASSLDDLLRCQRPTVSLSSICTWMEPLHSAPAESRRITHARVVNYTVCDGGVHRVVWTTASKHPHETMAHTIMLIQPSTPESKTYSDYNSIKECMEGICRIFEEHLKKVHPSSPSITYDISELFEFIDKLTDLSCLVLDTDSKCYYVPRNKEWIKEKIYVNLSKEAAK